jgi:hypothetical protein
MTERFQEILELANGVALSTDKHLAMYKSGASSRNIGFEISDEEASILFCSVCHYCGYQAPHRLNGIDRVVNTLGYVKGNVVACCSYCNRAKGRTSTAPPPARRCLNPTSKTVVKTLHSPQAPHPYLNTLDSL